MIRPVLSLCILLGACAAFAAPDAHSQEGDWNALVLEKIREMPSGGGYSTGPEASRLLREAIALGPRGLTIDAAHAAPSYCSGATYLVFTSVCQQLIRDGRLALSPAARAALLVTGQRDGEGLWGRWNANGPGTARLFHELQIGRNFTDWKSARPGDFMKIFWTTEIGQRERGHSVIFLGTEREAGVDYVRFWSSNKPLGYGEKRVTRRSVAYAIFSRLETPGNLLRLDRLPPRDAYLASMLSTPSTPAEVRARCGM